VVNLDQFRITTGTILAKERFSGRFSSFPSSKATMNKVYARTPVLTELRTSRVFTSAAGYHVSITNA
jgi:hypothetical protein